MKDSLKEDLFLDETERKKYELFLEIKRKTNNDSKAFIQGEIKMLHIGFEYYYVENGNPTIFPQNSRFISFINEKKEINKKFFIHDQDSLSIALNEAEIKDAVLIKEKKENDGINNYNSNDSKKSNDSALSAAKLKVENILDEPIISIMQQKPIKISEIFSHDNFVKRFNIGKISELDFNVRYYEQFANDFEVDLVNINQDWFLEMNDFYKKVKYNSNIFNIRP